MAKARKAAASKAKNVAGRKLAAKNTARVRAQKNAARSRAEKPAAKPRAPAARAEKRATAKPRKASKSKQPQKVKLKAHRTKQPVAKAPAKAKPKAASLKHAASKAPSKPPKAPNKVAIKKEQRLATLKAVGKKALEKVQAAHHSQKPEVKPQPAVAAKPAPTAPVAKKSTRGLTAKERALVKEFERRELSPADAEARRLRLKNLIVLGKERTYLTYAEINDHLPDDMMDAEQIENIIGM
ncbi:MAG: polymerase sigma factor RpoD, partial [Betaproteobacteria bacterium]|nr:polymerase sigma factor RpoD [Betaproteobacteria bacterium]